jgi:hypothetical protein
MSLRGSYAFATGHALVRNTRSHQAKPRFFRSLVAGGRVLSPSPANGNSKVNGATEIPSTVEEASVEEYTTPKNNANHAPAPSPTAFLESLSNDAVDASGTNWSKSYHGLSSEPFSQNIADILQAPLDPEDVEMKPGILRRH